MSIFLKELITKKIKQLTSNEILHYARQYGFSLTTSEAKDITAYLKNNSIDPFDAKDREKMFRELAHITNMETAKKAQKLFIEMIKSYGLESLFN